MIVLTPTVIEKALIARCLLESGILIGSPDEIWTHPSAYRALVTWKLCVYAITELIGGGHGVQPSFIKACVMQTDGISNTQYALDEIAEFLVDDPVARRYWDGLTCDSYYPHKCPHCGSACFIGFLHVDCKMRCLSSSPR